MKDEIYFFRTDSKEMILDPASQLIWKIGENISSLEKLEEGRYSIQNFCNRIQQTNVERNEEICSALRRLLSYNFFIRKENETIYSTSSFNHIVINPSSECNLNCWYCYAKEFRKENSLELNLDKIKTTIRYFAERKRETGSIKPLSISLFFLSEINLDFQTFLEVKSFIEIIKHDFDFKIFLFPPSTNLIQIEQDFIDYINEYGFLTVSVDYTNKRQIQEVMNILPKFKDNVVKHCIIPLHSGMNNLFEIYLKFMRVFDYVSLRPVRIGNNAKFPWNLDSLTKLNCELNTLCMNILKMKNSDLSRFLLSLGPSDYFLRYFQRIISRSKLDHRCSAGFTSIAVGPDSDFYPCSGFIGRTNFKLGSIEKGLNMISVSEYQEKINNSFLCKECPIRYYCGGFCEDWKQMIDKKQGTQNIECIINQIFFKNCSAFALQLLEARNHIIRFFTKEKRIDMEMSNPVDFLDFASFFTATD